MEALGRRLPEPKTGWKRYDDTDVNIVYSKNGFADFKTTVGYGGSYKRVWSPGHTATFEFYGTDFRLIGPKAPDFTSSMFIEFDGEVTELSLKQSYISMNVVLFEALNLKEGKHRVVIMSNTTDISVVDAFDINAQGHILPPVQNDENNGHSCDIKTTHISDLPKTNIVRDNDLLVVNKDGKTYGTPLSAIRGIGSGSGDPGVVNPAYETGTMFEYIGNNDIKGYLKCDGRILKINDYYALSGCITDSFGSVNVFGGDGEVTFALPNFKSESVYYDLLSNVTSDTDDVYEIAASGSYNELYPFWHAFNQDVTKGWTSIRSSNQWISLKSETPIENVNSYSISARKDTASYDVSEAPKDWKFYVKRDDEWVLVDSRSDIVFLSGEKQTFTIDHQEPFNEFKIEFTKNGANANSIISIGNIQLHRSIPLKTTYIKY